MKANVHCHSVRLTAKHLLLFRSGNWAPSAGDTDPLIQLILTCLTGALGRFSRGYAMTVTCFAISCLCETPEKFTRSQHSGRVEKNIMIRFDKCSTRQRDSTGTIAGGHIDLDALILSAVTPLQDR